MSRSTQYLLDVAQKIINSYADKLVIQKYYRLKRNLTFDQPSFNKNESKNINDYIGDTAKTSIAAGIQKNAKRSLSRKSTSNIGVSKQCRQECQGNRLDTFGSRKATKRCQSQQQLSQELLVLNRLASLLKNIQNHPNQLKTIKICQERSVFPMLQSYISSIQNSLANIYDVLMLRQKGKQKGPTKRISEPAQQFLSNEQITSDNRWLVNKLQVLIGENTALRRIVGSKVY